MQHPSDPMFYSAVVSESKARPNYQELARDKALRDIAMQISTQIDASISVSEREAWGIASSEYLSTLQATSSASIRDLQLRDSFETDKMYYAWYRLNKAEYEAQRRLLRDRALASSVDLLNRYHGAASDPATAIPLLLQAFG
ncbi:MAG: LPP20 family lipoprotein [Candidatus Cloacimonetes bacterium]|nr:LPP20 family lipoprotein [Candidatus Cloacimonadota bacterium]